MRKLHILLVSVLFTATIAAQSQPAEQRIKTMYLLLGTLSDYMGRYTYINKANQVDEYHYFEKPLVDFLDSIIQNDLQFKVEVSQAFFNGRYETFSKDLSDSISCFYEDNMLKDSLFRTKEEVCSFLAGKYYRYGQKLNDSIFKIQISNTPDHKIIEVLLKRVGCNKIHYKYLSNIPAQYIYYFIPTNELYESFERISHQKEALSLSYKKAAVSLLGLNNEYEKQIKLKNDKDLMELIGVFSNEDGGMTVRDSSAVERK